MKILFETNQTKNMNIYFDIKRVIYIIVSG